MVAEELPVAAWTSCDFFLGGGTAGLGSGEATGAGVAKLCLAAHEACLKSCPEGKSTKSAFHRHIEMQWR
ncbi:hypothetical protein AV530_018114 [Patagioenas fasciata monilis]|uniref:Uncharacterized protein n=1 Tax=Patagioenas fasciata monilis TaxID=372326 RepID=A0A1V4KKV2_PATFA|nr:hypothetical protein AV530_018114 [Patagioenas fasciata monilis]